MTPEIINDPLSHWLTRLASEPDVRTICEIGSGDGSGSTQALLRGMNKLESCKLACLETRRERFDLLSTVLVKHPGNLALRNSSTPVIAWMSKADVAEFYQSTLTMLNRQMIEEVLNWLDEEVSAARDLPQNGIQAVKTLWQIGNFDLVLLDGCPFSGEADLEAVYGSRILVLDDTNCVKNWANYNRLVDDGRYKLVAEDQSLRNGYAIFRLNS